ncbi:hypothetical protein LBMAG21_17360 [Armatimonadota bacterium]|nr:hypothetical protein LBMAG21_17360 [Armatimonadota bacterium]
MAVQQEVLEIKTYSHIERRDTSNGRIAYMKSSRLPVWQVVKLAKSYNMDAEKTAAYWGEHCSKEWVESALDYYRDFPEEIDALIQASEQLTFETLQQRLPQLERIALPVEGEAE